MGISSTSRTVFRELEKAYWFVDGRYLKKCYEEAAEKWFGHKGELNCIAWSLKLRERSTTTQLPTSEKTGNPRCV
jgi:hypothetical protein